MKVVPETRRALYIRYLRFYWSHDNGWTSYNI